MTEEKKKLPSSSSISQKHLEKPEAKHIIFWSLAVGLVLVAEIVAVFTVAATDVLSATMWWLYGERYSLRWWLIGGQVAALLYWVPPHWLFPEIGAQVLLIMSLTALVIGLGGWVVTQFVLA
jgi:hypothetical protein